MEVAIHPKGDLVSADTIGLWKCLSIFHAYYKKLII